MATSLCLQLLGVQHDSKLCSSNILNGQGTERKLTHSSAVTTVMLRITKPDFSPAHLQCRTCTSGKASYVQNSTSGHSKADSLLFLVKVSRDCREHMLKVDPAVHAQL